MDSAAVRKWHQQRSAEVSAAKARAAGSAPRKADLRTMLAEAARNTTITNTAPVVTETVISPSHTGTSTGGLRKDPAGAVASSRGGRP